LSSILKALKKLENDPAQLDVVYPWSRKAAVRGNFVSTLVSPLFKMGGLISVTGILALGGWYISESISKSNEIHTEEKPSIQHKGAPHPEASADTQETKLQPPKVASQRPVRRDGPRVTNTPAGSRDNPITISDHLLEEAAVLPPSIGEPMSPEDETDAEGITESKTLSSRSRTLSLIEERKDDTRLKLQAIAWSPDPEKRIGVINDRVVKEGGSIDGIVVNHIGQDQVVVQEGGQTWKIVFDLK
jgi:hypothetical protein